MAYDATFTRAATYIAGKFGQALEMMTNASGVGSGNNVKVACGGSSLTGPMDFQLTDQWAIDFWFYVPSGAQSGYFFQYADTIYNDPSINTNQLAAFYIGGSLYIQRNNGANAPLATINDGATHHLALQYVPGTGLYWWLDGAHHTVLPYAYGYPVSPSLFLAGGTRPDSSPDVNGAWIDDFCIRKGSIYTPGNDFTPPGPPTANNTLHATNEPGIRALYRFENNILDSAVLIGVTIDSPTAPITVPAQTQQQFHATVTNDSGGSGAVTWSASGGSITNTGLWTAPATAGNYTITATSVTDNTRSGSVTATVPLTIAVTPSTATIGPSQTQQFSATLNSGANTVTWTVPGGLGGSINSSGIFTPDGTPGTWTVRATSVADNTKYAEATVTVVAISVAISPTTTSLLQGATKQFHATVTNDIGSAGVTWECSAGNQYVTSSGLFTAPNAGGPVTVTARSVVDTTKTATATVTVASVTIAITPNPANVGVLGTLQMAAAIGGSVFTEVAWSVDAGQGSIDSATGLYTAPANGNSYTVTATHVASQQTATRIVVVSPIGISPNTPHVAPNQSQQFSAVNDGTPTTDVTWAVVTSGGGSITTGGLYTAPSAPGTYTVTATLNADNTKVGTVTVTVAAISIAVTPPSVILGANSTQQFSADVRNDATNQGVTWRVNGAGSIDANGLYTASSSSGSATVIATSVADPTKTASVQVTVVLSTTAIMQVDFSPTKAGLTTVGYALISGDDGQTVVRTRTTNGVYELGDGSYGAPVTFPGGFAGFIEWSTGDDNPEVAREPVNPVAPVELNPVTVGGYLPGMDAASLVLATPGYKLATAADGSTVAALIARGLDAVLMPAADITDAEVARQTVLGVLKFLLHEALSDQSEDTAGLVTIKNDAGAVLATREHTDDGQRSRITRAGRPS